jgi:hypothetical protein
MSEDQFTDELVRRLDLRIPGCKIETRKSLLYDLSIDERGVAKLAVDKDSGDPIRGGGKGFQQDILIYETVQGGDTSVVPRVVTEVKFQKVNTHDPIIYSEKARRIRSVYPYVRYGLLLGSMPKIPGRVLRLGQGFDFIFTVAYPFTDYDLQLTRQLFTEEIETSRELSTISSGKHNVTCFRRAISIRR